VTDEKKTKGREVPPATAGAVRPPSPSKFPRTLVAEPVPPELKAAALEREKTIEVSASDADVMIETNPSITKSVKARAVGTQEPTDPGVLQRRRQLRRRIALAAAGGLGLIAAAIAARGVAHRASASARAPAEVPAASSPAASVPAVASSSPQPAAAAPSAAEPAVATADSATSPPDGQAPAASASAKTPAPKAHPARPKHAPTKVVR
jgi:hypothetical protein